MNKSIFSFSVWTLPELDPEPTIQVHVVYLEGDPSKHCQPRAPGSKTEGKAASEGYVFKPSNYFAGN